MKILPPVQKHHPDTPSTGWTCTVLDGKGLLVARFYGATPKRAERNAKMFVLAVKAYGRMKFLGAEV